MKTAPFPENEKQRVAELEALAILDTAAEQEFDEIASLATLICGLPIALLSLVDTSRQWFKAKCGIEASETPREIAFCAHSILQSDIFEIPDATQDERFFDNPLVTNAPYAIFYAGMPVFTKSGMPVGTLCVIDHKPNALTDTQREGLKMLARQVGKLLEMRMLNQNLTRANALNQDAATALRNMNAGVVLHDKNGAIVSFNPAALEVLGLTADQLQGKTSLDPTWRYWKENHSPFPADEHPAMLALRTGRTQREVVMGVETQQQGLRWLMVNAQPIFMEGSQKVDRVVATFSDITEAKNSESSIVQRAKFVSLGEMAGGIAHEINTPLAFIGLTTELLLEAIEENSATSEFLKTRIEKIQSTSQRISVIVKGLKTFSRDSSLDPPVPADINSILDDTLALCFEKFKVRGIEISNQVSEAYWVKCVPSKISQVLLNLLNNAFDAIVESERRWIRVKASRKEGFIKVSVIDSGCGIAPHVVSRLMTPFFTTKEPGRGTGIGLSISKGILEEFSGKFYYELLEGNTCFSFELPECESLEGTHTID